MDKETIESLKEKFNTVRSKKALLEQLLEEKKKERDQKAEELKESGVDIEGDLDLTREELEAKTKELSDRLIREIDIWENKIDDIKKDIFK